MEESKEEDRRASERFAVDQVTGSLLLTSNAKVLNLSVDGMAIETEGPLQVGREYSLRLSQGEKTIPLTGKVVWCFLVRTRPGESGEFSPVYRAGIHFEEVLTDRAHELRRFIGENAVISLEKRLFGRFRLDRARNTNVRCEAGFRVVELSSAGMLIETDLALRVDTVHEMEVRLPELSFRAKARIARADSLDRESDDGHELHLVGVEFAEIDPEVTGRLRDLMRQLDV